MRPTPRWVEYILGDLVPAFGGMPTFCEDPDGLLDLPTAREALRAAGMTIGDWDGLATSLVQYKSVSDDEMPLLVVEPGAPQHVVQSCLQDYRWESVSFGEMLPKFAHEVVRAVPAEHWDALFALHDEVRSPRSTQDTALLIARAVYGVDPEHLRHGDGWFRSLVRVATGDEPLPSVVARAVAETASSPWCAGDVASEELLSSITAARSQLERVRHSLPEVIDSASPSDRILVAQLGREQVTPQSRTAGPDILALWKEAQGSHHAVFDFGLQYANAVANGTVADDVRAAVNQQFETWIIANYGVLSSAANPALLRLPTLVSRLDAELEQDRLLFVVVDALGLEAWRAVQDRWKTEGVIGRAETRVALAVLPTITSLSRRSIFEGKPPSQFGPEKHSQRLERKLWAARFGDDSGWFTVDEEIGFHDALSQGKRRICLLDVTWDKRGHSIDPRTDSIVEAARTWAGKTPLRSLVTAGLRAGYRVVISADHGQVSCSGKQRIHVGVLSEERSKRVMLFKDKTVAQHYEVPWSTYYKPAGGSTDTFPLFARAFNSFDSPGVPSVSHGGLSLEEAFVPVAEVVA